MIVTLKDNDRSLDYRYDQLSSTHLFSRNGIPEMIRFSVCQWLSSYRQAILRAALGKLEEGLDGDHGAALLRVPGRRVLSPRPKGLGQRGRLLPQAMEKGGELTSAICNRDF